MRRLRKIHYYVQDWNKDQPHFWWYKGDWCREIGPGSRNQKRCRNFHNALKWARRLRAKGGVPLISQGTIVKGRHVWRDFRLAYCDD